MNAPYYPVYISSCLLTTQRQLTNRCQLIGLGKFSAAHGSIDQHINLRMFETSRRFMTLGNRRADPGGRPTTQGMTAAYGNRKFVRRLPGAPPCTNCVAS